MKQILNKFQLIFKGSRWTFQATRMNGETFGGLFTILPDQMQVANPVLILLFIPLFDYVIYPMLSKLIRSARVLFPNITLLIIGIHEKRSQKVNFIFS